MVVVEAAGDSDRFVSERMLLYAVQVWGAEEGGLDVNAVAVQSEQSRWDWRHKHKYKVESRKVVDTPR